MATARRVVDTESLAMVCGFLARKTITKVHIGNSRMFVENDPCFGAGLLPVQPRILVQEKCGKPRNLLLSKSGLFSFHPSQSGGCFLYEWRYYFGIRRIVIS